MRIPRDKLLHFVGGFAFGVLCRLVADSWSPWVMFTVAILAGAALGIGKEIYDHQHPDRHTSEWLDAAATLGGCILGTLALHFILAAF